MGKNELIPMVRLFTMGYPAGLTSSVHQNQPIMKLTIMLFSLGITMSIVLPAQTTTTPVKGSWKMVKSKYGDEKEYTDYAKEGLLTYKLFTGTRWAGSSYDTKTRKISGTNGGTYTLTGQTYTETVEYFSWDATTEGKTFQFSVTIENGMLHQFGYIEYKGNTKYLIDEWYTRVD